jgi:hypothetical protein
MQARLVEIKDEEASLGRAFEHLGPNGEGAETDRSDTDRRSARKASRARAGRKRAAPGERQRQLVDVIKKMPGASPNELADAIGIGSTQVYGLARSLEGKGEIRKKGQGFELAS